MDMAVGVPVIRQHHHLWIGTTIRDISWETPVSIAFLINNESKNCETEIVSFGIIQILDILNQKQFTLIHDGIDLIVNGKRFSENDKTENAPINDLYKLALNQTYGQIAIPSMTMPAMPTPKSWAKISRIMNWAI